MKLIATVLLLCTTALAQNVPDNPLRSPRWEFRPWVGGGTGLGFASEFKFVNAGFRVGRVLTGEVGEGKLRGTFEWSSDLMPLYMVRQSDFYDSGPQRWVYGGGFNAVNLMWNFTASDRVVPFIAAEGGVLFSRDEIPPGDTSRVNFLPGGAFGIHFLRGDRQAFTVSIHVTHVSNASLAEHNPGINASLQFRVGYTWFK